ncbi:MAG: NAD(P)-dependent dehydrogenase (short-subunit alcohol dehydrogenase family) [Myxococcota bacterium]|jgi:NAD(P)-dependent dehydrogenase (short-subunit alcohol dehydrogenase family)
MGLFDGKAVWITGGGSGIGRAVALAFAQEGASVAVSGRRQARIDKVAEEIQAMGQHAIAVQCDVTDEEQVQHAVKEVVAGLGKLDVAIANAGFSVGGPFEKISAADWRRQLDVNVVGAATTARVALPHLRETKGRIAFVASVAGMVAIPKSSAYCASKFALRAIGLSLSAELHGSGVSCTTLNPGFVESEINQVDNKGKFHESRKDTRPAKFMWPTDKAARVMLKAIHRRKREYTFTGHGKVGGWMGRHMPGAVHFAMTRNKAKKSATKVTG